MSQETDIENFMGRKEAFFRMEVDESEFNNLDFFESYDSFLEGALKRSFHSSPQELGCNSPEKKKAKQTCEEIQIENNSVELFSPDTAANIEKPALIHDETSESLLDIFTFLHYHTYICATYLYSDLLIKTYMHIDNKQGEQNTMPNDCRLIEKEPLVANNVLVQAESPIHKIEEFNVPQLSQQISVISESPEFYHDSPQQKHLNQFSHKPSNDNIKGQVCSFHLIFETKYSKMVQVKFAEDSL